MTGGEKREGCMRVIIGEAGGDGDFGDWEWGWGRRRLSYVGQFGR